MALRFCFPTTFYPPYSFGGDGIAVQRLARALVRRGHSVTVVHDVDAFVAASGGTPPEIASDDDGVEIISLHTRMGRIAPLLAQQTGQPTLHRHRLKEILDKGSFDVVHFHNVSLIGGPGLFGLARGATTLYSAHEHWLVCPTHVLWRHKRELCPARQCIRCQLRYRRPPQLWRYGPRLRHSFDQVDLFIAMSEFSRAKHAEFGFPREMHVLPPFVDDPIVTEDDASPHHRPYFFFAGRLEKIKGLHTVVPLMAAVPEADLVVAGDGSYRETLAQMSAGQVRFLGSVSQSGLARYYRHAVATLVPSISYETFGQTLIESFAACTPVIARRLGPFPEIVNACNGGLLFSGDDELIAAMRALVSESGLRNQLAENALRGHRERWSEAVVVPRYLELASLAAARVR